MVSGDLEESLGDEIGTHITGRLNGVREEITRLQSQLNEAFTRLLEQSFEDTHPDPSVTAAITEHLRAAHEQGIHEAEEESSRAKMSSEIAIIKAAVNDMDNVRSQASILGSLVNRAACFAPRVAFFVIRNEQAVGWRARGLEGTVGDESITDVVMPLSDDTPLSDVAKTRTTWSGSPGSKAADHKLLASLGGEPPQRMITIPLVVRDRSVAVLYADSATLDANAVNLEALEILVRVAGMAVELLAVNRPTPVERSTGGLGAEGAAPSQQSQPAEKPAVTFGYDRGDVAAGSSETAREAEPSFSDKEAHIDQPSIPQVDHISDVADAPAPVPQATTTRKAADESFEGLNTSAQDHLRKQQVSHEYATPLGTAKQYGASNAQLPVDVNEEEGRLHNDARRFARLLVSEIKLYNEQKVRDGVLHGDLYGRLREDINRSREMYDKRVSPPVASRYDYFHHELVKTLAEGDLSKLGQDYPGAHEAA